MQDDEITHIPRRVKKGKKPKPPKKMFERNQCKHPNCDSFKTAANRNGNTFDDWKHRNRALFHNFTHSQQVNFLSTLVTFKQPRNLSDFRKWTSNAHVTVNKYPKSYEIALPGPRGFGRYKICGEFFQFVFGIGRKRFQTLMCDLWKTRASGNIACVTNQNYSGYQNKKGEAPWIKLWELDALANCNLCRSHYTDDKDTIYFDLKAGTKETWETIHAGFIKRTQPLRYENWINENRTNPRDPEIPKPHPCYEHFLQVIPKIYKVKPHRVSQDKCNGCQQFRILHQKAQTEVSKQEYTRLHQMHLRRASMMYQLNSHFKKWATNSFSKQNIIPKRLKDLPINFMQHKNTFRHFEIDFDLDHPECITNCNMAYFKRKITVKSLNVITHPADEHGTRKAFLWSGMHGGKQAEHVTTCLELLFQQMSIGAERGMVNLDGALLTYKVLKAAAFYVHEKNPNRYFRSLFVSSPETGHSRLEADTINKQAKDQYNKREQFTTTRERVKYLNECTNVEVKQVLHFANLPTIFDVMFLKNAKWVDQFNKKALIRDDKGMIYEFGESLQWNSQTSKFEWIKHMDEMWIRCNEDLTKPVRKVKIFSEAMKTFKKEQLQFVHRSRKEAPSIKRDVLNDTLEIARMCTPDEDIDLQRYFNPDRIDEETGELKQVTSNHHFGKIVTKVRRRQQFSQMLDDGNIVELEKYENECAEEKQDVDCKIEPCWTIQDVSKKLVREIKPELTKHKLQTTGKKQILIERLIEHYKTQHNLS